MLPRVLCLMGPTASGKTALGLALAHRYDGEVINADARQLYRDAPIGTGVPIGAWQPTEAGEGYFVDGIRHHLLAVSGPDETWTVSRWQRAALDAIEDVLGRNRLPIIVGGTGLYIRALSEGYVFTGAPDPQQRETLLALHPEERRARLMRLDPEMAARTDLQNPHRVLRALERALSGVAAPARVSPPYAFLKLVLDPDADRLRSQIEARIAAQWSAGWPEEVRALLARGVPLSSPLMQSIGFRTLAEALTSGTFDEGRAKASLLRETWLYARRQRTWFRREPQAHPVRTEAEAIALIDPWLAKGSPFA